MKSDIPTPINPNSLFFKPIEATEVIETVFSLNNTSSIDPICTKFFRFVINGLSHFLTEFFNESIFPSLFKVSKVIPIHKSGPKSDISNYRPISLVPQLAKILEKLIAKRLCSFFLKFKILSQNQFGFIEHRNTSHAALKLVHDTIPAIKDQNYSLSLFVDFSKAFDCVPHDRLLSKLHNYGIRNPTYCLLQSYLKNRSQYVCINNPNGKVTNSSILPISIGVPQGTSIAPLLFILYANDLVDYLCSFGADVVMYADDTVITVRGHSVDEVVRKCNHIADKLFYWCLINKITVNKLKTKFMIVSNKFINLNFDLLLDNSVIELVSSFNYLGITIDRKLKFSDHISIIETKISRAIGIIRKFTYSFDIPTAITFYYCFIYSIISYGICVWGGCIAVYKHQSLLDKLDRAIQTSLQG